MGNVAELRGKVFKGAARKRATVTLGSGDDAVEVDVVSLSNDARALLMNECRIVKVDDDGDAESGDMELDLGKMSIALVIECTYVKGTNERLFTEADRDVIGESDAGYFTEVVQTASTLSGLSKAARKEAEGNS